MQEAIVENPKVNAEILVVWIDVLPFDGRRTAAKSSKIFSQDSRLRYFHDPEKRAGNAVSQSLKWDEFAWDIYLVYPAGAQWKQGLPAPQAYVHQLGGDDEHSCTEETLMPCLKKLVAPLVAAQ